MASSSTHDLASSSIVNKKSNPARPGSEGYLAHHPGLGLVLFLIGALTFGIIAFNVRTNGPLLAWDMPIDQAIHVLAVQNGPLGVNLAIFGSSLGSYTSIAIAVLIILYWLFKRRWFEISMLLIGNGGGSLWFLIISNFFRRHRPVFPDPVTPVLTIPGFPSGHTIYAVLFYGCILNLLLPHLLKWRWRFLAVLGAVVIVLIVAYSRLYLGEHYPTDVLAAIGIGFAWGALVYTSMGLLRLRHYARLRKTPD